MTRAWAAGRVEGYHAAGSDTMLMSNDYGGGRP